MDEKRCSLERETLLVKAEVSIRLGIWNCLWEVIFSWKSIDNYWFGNNAVDLVVQPFKSVVIFSRFSFSKLPNMRIVRSWSIRYSILRKRNYTFILWLYPFARGKAHYAIDQDHIYTMRLFLKPFSRKSKHKHVAKQWRLRDPPKKDSSFTNKTKIVQRTIF